MLARRLLNRGLLTVGSVLLVVVASVLVVCCLWLLNVRQGDSDGFALATVITGFIAAVTAVIPATAVAIFMIAKSYRFGDAPYHCLPTRMKDPFRGASAAAFALSVVPSALGISLPSTYATCASGRSRWHFDLPCYLLKATWALCLAMMVLSVLVLLPLRSAVRTSAIIPTKAASDTESTSSLEKPPIAAYGWLAAERPPTREQQRWMQKHNSLSSQKAIYPYAFDSMRPASSWSSGGGYSPFPRPSNAWRANSFSDGPQTWSSSGSTIYMSGSRPSLARPSTAGSRPATGLSYSSASTYSRRYRLDHSANCPAIPESPHRLSFAHLGPRPKTANDAPDLPPPAWCPQLTHAPLSSDPAIRALTGSRTRLSQRLSRLPALTGISPVLSRQSTTSTSILDPGTGRPNTAPSAATSPTTISRSRSTAATGPTNATTTFAFVFGVDTKTPPQPAPTSSLPPLPGFPLMPSSGSPPAVPPRARGHVLSPSPASQPQVRSPSLVGSPLLHAGYSPRIENGSASRSASRGADIRYLRRPSPLRLRTDASREQTKYRSESGIRKATEHKSGISPTQQVPVRSQSRGRSHLAHTRASPAHKPSSVSPVKQQKTAARQPPATRYRGRSHTKKPVVAASAGLSTSISRGMRTRGYGVRATAAVSSSPPPVPQDERTTAVSVPDTGRAVRKSTAAAMTAAMVGVVRGRSVSVGIHEQRGREKIQRGGQEGWYTPSCYSVEGGSGA